VPSTPLRNRLDRPVDSAYDHILGPADASITLVEYGSYACPYCRAANARINEVRAHLGDRLRYVYRHQPLVGSALARRAAELSERAVDADHFWDVHVSLMTRSETLTEADLAAVAADLRLSEEDPAKAEIEAARAKERVDRDEQSAIVSGALITPTFFINGRRYDGAWDEASFVDAMLGSLSHRVRSAALDFAAWAPSSGMLLLVATLLAVAVTNSAIGPSFDVLWNQHLGFVVGGANYEMSALHWINDALLTLFFLVVGLEVKREFTVGHLANPRAAALPIAGAIGGMVMPAVLYALLIPAGPWSGGWGIPMATDTAFAVALIVMMGSRVPIELRIFLTAAAIVDDIGSIIVVAIFHSGTLNLVYLAAAITLCCGLALLGRSRIYSLAPYTIAGVALWACVYASGLHATLTGVLLAFFIPTRPPPNLEGLMGQANSIMEAETRRNSGVLRNGLSVPAALALDAIYDRLESPADCLLRCAGARSSYIVLPLFALANAGVAVTWSVLHGHSALMRAVFIGLVVGKPLGWLSACALAVWTGLAVKPAEYSWQQLAGAAALAGIGFTMSLFIAGQALPIVSDLAAAKIAVFSASILSATIGVALLWAAGAPRRGGCEAVTSACAPEETLR
jgi:Na+:H+ antiporter, NhaA family